MNIKILGGKVCEMDLSEIIRQHGVPLAVQVAPNSNPYTTKFLLKDGTQGIITSIAPTYYLHKSGEHRPITEVALRAGNANIILNEKWGDIHPFYLTWLKDRQRRMFGTELLIASPYSMTDTLMKVGRLIPRNTLAMPLLLLFAFVSKGISMLPFVGLTTFTGYPASGAADPVDGLVWRGGYPDVVNQTFANIRAGAGTGVSSTGASGQVNMEASSTNPNFEMLARFIGVFDTSSIPTGSTISSATIGFCAAGKGDEGIGVCDIHAFWATTASNSALATGDFASSVPAASLGSIAFASIATGAGSTTYNTITLSSTTNINMGTSARTKLGLGHKWDVLNDSTGFTWASGHLNSYVTQYFADEATGGKPKLTVTYTAGSSIIPAMATLGVGA